MECDAPVSIKFNPPKPDGKGGLIHYFPAGCGKCLPCLTKRKAQWAFRINEEARKSISAYFITLTYDDAHLPLGDGVSTVNKQDHFNFIKHLKLLERNEVLEKRYAI